jgi:hypothetical protein
MNLYNLVSEEEEEPIMPGRIRSLTIEGDGFVAGSVTIVPSPRMQNIEITIRNLSYDKASASMMTKLLKEIGQELIKMSNGALGKEPYLTDWSYKILQIDFDLGDIINKDSGFLSRFSDGSNTFGNHFVGRRKPLSDLFSDVIRGVLPWTLDVPSIEKEYLKAKRRLEFAQTEHFTDGEYDNYEFKSNLVHPQITTNHRVRLAQNDVIDGKTILIEAERLDITYYAKVVNKEIQTPPSWEEGLAKHVLHYYLINGINVEEVRIIAMEKGLSFPARNNRFHFRRDDII